MFVLDFQYPVVFSFRDWLFPHDKIPDSWPRLYEVSCTNRCTASNYTRHLTPTRIVPKEERDWFMRNDTTKYSSEPLLRLKTPNNLVPMKADVHNLFDAAGFVIVPKKFQTDGVSEHKYVTHIITRAEREFWPTYHNVLAQYLHIGRKTAAIRCRRKERLLMSLWNPRAIRMTTMMMILRVQRRG